MISLKPVYAPYKVNSEPEVNWIWTAAEEKHQVTIRVGVWGGRWREVGGGGGKRGEVGSCKAKGEMSFFSVCTLLFYWTSGKWTFSDTPKHSNYTQM